MDEDLRTDELPRSHLLGKLPEEAAERLGERLIEDEELFELCEAVEADLLAAYDRGELTGLEKEQVLRLASSPGGRERLAFARALNTVAGDPSESWLVRLVQAPLVFFRRRAASDPQFGIRWDALAAAVLLAVIGVLWFYDPTPPDSGAPPRVANRISTPAHRPSSGAPVKPAAPLTKAPAAKQPRTESDRLAQRDERTAQPSEPLKAVIMLSLATLRSAEGVEEFRIPANVELVEIQLDLEGLDDRESFHVAVRGQGNEKVWEKGGLAPRRLDWGTALVLEIPADSLLSGRYEVAVKAGSDEITKTFAVVREAR